MRRMQRQIWTSAEVARAFRVGVSSVKRWTDDGELESIRTPGGHRRYTMEALHRFAGARGLPVDALPAVMAAPPARITLFEALVRGDEEAVRALMTPSAEYLDREVGDALRQIGERWAEGRLGVDEEHRASALLATALDRLRPAVDDDAPLAMLACPPGELHDLPLRLVRLVLEWNGWRTELYGAALPWESARAAIERSRPALFALTARDASPFRTPKFEELARFCASRKVQLAIGGGWARGGQRASRGVLRFRTLRGFERWLSSG